MKTRLPKAYNQAIELIKGKGFTHLKLELEAELNRGSADNRCDECDDGWNSCHNCDARGFVILENDITVECDYCNGEGSQECGNCNGRGRSRDTYDIGWCKQFLREHMGQETRESLVFDKFYDDGSVDSEYTFTLPIDKAHLCLNVIKAFKQLSYEITGDFPNIENAGMHVSILPSGIYPCRRGLLNTRYMKNFRTEVTKLLPALYFVSTHNDTTRSLEYRGPRVSNEDKYSAIFTHEDTCIEYRVFDTCYDQPEALLEKIQIIAGTLKYYSTQKVQIKYREFFFPESQEDSLIAGWFNQIDNLDALNQTLKHLKPPAKTARKLKHERGLRATRQALASELQRTINNVEANYRDYAQEEARRNNRRIKYYINDFKAAFIEGSQIVELLPFASKEAFTANPEMFKKLLKNDEKAFKYFKSHQAQLGIDTFHTPTLREWAKNELYGSRTRFDLAHALNSI